MLHLARDVEAQNDTVRSSEVVRYNAPVRVAASGIPLYRRHEREEGLVTARKVSHQ